MGSCPGALGQCLHARCHRAPPPPWPIVNTMISITLSWFVCFYLALFLAGVLILWLGYEIQRKRSADSISRDRVFCRICGSRYTNGGDRTILHCPVCGSLNERNSPGRKR